jgi:hypothetical protein
MDFKAASRLAPEFGGIAIACNRFHEVTEKPEVGAISEG